MNMFIHELKAYRKSAIAWTCAMSLLVIFLMSIYPDFSKNGVEVKRILDGYPEEVRKAVGANVEVFTTLLGFYSYVFGYIVLCGAIQAMNLGVSVLSKETRQKTADFLLSKPVSRRQIITAKLFAVLTWLVITNVVYLIVAFSMTSAVKNGSLDLKIFLMITVTLFFVQLIFMAVGIFISAAARKIKSVLPISLGTVFGLFILSMFDSVIGDQTVRYMTPFKYYDSMYIIRNGAYEMQYTFVEMVVIIAAIWASYVIYARKDVHA